MNLSEKIDLKKLLDDTGYHDMYIYSACISDDDCVYLLAYDKIKKIYSIFEMTDDYKLSVFIDKVSGIENVPQTIYIDNNSGSHFNTFKDSFRIYKEIFKFSLSSLFSFLIDYFLFIIFSLFINLTISNILARIISATFNYNFNKKIVFHKNSEKSAMKYILLAITILVFNTLILNGLVYNIIYK